MPRAYIEGTSLTASCICSPAPLPQPDDPAEVVVRALKNVRNVEYPLSLSPYVLAQNSMLWGLGFRG